EIVIGLCALAVPTILSAAVPLYRLVYPHVTDNLWLLTMLRFAIAFAVLLVPTTCMGATLPLLVRYATAAGMPFGRSVGVLYGVNTMGAVFGTAAAGFYLIPAFGMALSTMLAAAVNLSIGLLAIAWLRQDRAEESKASPTLHPTVEPVPATSRRAVLGALAASGFAAMAYQITWTRALIVSLGSSTYSFTCVLTAFILGLGLGSLLMSRFADQLRRPFLVLSAMQWTIGLTALAIVPLQELVPGWVNALVTLFASRFELLLGVEFLLIVAITVIPTLLIGGVFPLAARLIIRPGEAPAAATGRAYAANTVGTVLGAFVTGFVLIRSDVLGIQNTIVTATILNGAAGWCILALAPPGERPRLVGLATGALSVLALWAVGTHIRTWNPDSFAREPFFMTGMRSGMGSGSKILSYAEGVDFTVIVSQSKTDPDEIALRVNGKADASTALNDMVTQLLLGHIPGVLGVDDRSACVIGLGSGMTLAALAKYPNYELLDGVEISDEVIRAGEFFAPYCDHVLNNARVNLIRADGRNHLLLSRRTYDVIVSEPSNPWLAGVANLFTREFFDLCRDRLSEHGRLAVWLHGYFMALDDFRMVARTLCDAFESVSVWEIGRNNYLFVAARREPQVPLSDVIRRYREPSVRADLYRIGIHNAAQLLGGFLVSDAALRAWSAEAPPHTDDRTILEFSAPKRLYAISEAGDIARELQAISESPIGSWIIADAADGDHQDIVSQLDHIRRARGERMRALDHAEQAQYAEALQALYDGRCVAPTDRELYRLLFELRRTLEHSRPEILNTSAVSGRLEQLMRLRPPLFTPARGASLNEIAGMLLSRARVAARDDLTDIVLADLGEAADLSPDNLEIRFGFARA
ncbi:MAG: fused MFS/spermidine synthase, partial [Phycisphaerae bacterium]